MSNSASLPGGAVVWSASALFVGGGGSSSIAGPSQSPMANARPRAVATTVRPSGCRVTSSTYSSGLSRRKRSHCASAPRHSIGISRPATVLFTSSFASSSIETSRTDENRRPPLAYTAVTFESPRATAAASSAGCRTQKSRRLVCLTRVTRIGESSASTFSFSSSVAASSVGGGTRNEHRFARPDPSSTTSTTTSRDAHAASPTLNRGDVCSSTRFPPSPKEKTFSSPRRNPSI
mmetsp:Transcript_10287/g.43761  ORF Transcript_10287/g.43761 Transcript_10287/m.43761 type:complete len:234 (+) Transcript_10287:3152-3853(+)